MNIESISVKKSAVFFWRLSETFAKIRKVFKKKITIASVKA